MEVIKKELNKSKEYARLSMKILRAKRNGESQEVINQLLTERETLKIRTKKYNSKYNNFSPRIIVGTSDFKKLRLNNAIIVDKSLLIKAILEAPSEVPLIARPRRWGKSLNLDMLKTFFEIETDDRGQRLPPEKRINQKLFGGLKISADQQAMAQQGKHPVILFNLKETKGNNYQEIENNIIKKVQNTYEQHTYLENSSQLRPDEKQLFQKYLRGDINKADLQDSLHFLSKILYKHFQRTVYILIDEYDEVINSSYVKFGQKSEEFESILDLIRGILGSALKQNQYLEKGVLTGVFRIAKASLLSGLNNVVEYSLLEKRFSEYYGFTQEEVDDLLTKMTNIINRNEVKDWYNGYNFGGQIVYNPLSVMHYLSEGVLDTYWVDSGSTDLIDQVMLSDNNQIELQALLCGKSVTKRIYKQIAFDQIKENKDLFYSLLVFAGYLNPTLIEPDTYKLSMPPNQEIRKIYEDRVIQWVARKLNISVSDYDNFVNFLLEGEMKKFEEKLNHYLQNSTSYLDLKEEKDYHNLMGGILTPLSRKYLVESNKESGYGRYDHILTPKSNNPSNVAFILEYKVCQEESELETKTELGLNQIEKKLYDTQIKQNSQIRKITKTYLAFWKKKMMLKCKGEEIDQ